MEAQSASAMVGVAIAYLATGSCFFIAVLSHLQHLSSGDDTCALLKWTFGGAFFFELWSALYVQFSQQAFSRLPVFNPHFCGGLYFAFTFFFCAIYLVYFYRPGSTTLGPVIWIAGGMLLICALVCSVLGTEEDWIPSINYWQLVPVVLMLGGILVYRQGRLKETEISGWLSSGILLQTISCLSLLPAPAPFLDDWGLVSYAVHAIGLGCVLTGVLINDYDKLCQAEQNVKNLDWANEEVRQEMEERRWTEERLHESRIFAESIVETIRESLLVLDSELRVIRANRSFFQQFGLNPPEVVNNYFRDLGNGMWDVPDFLHELHKEITRGNRLEHYEITREFGELGMRTMLVSARLIYQNLTETNLILLTIEDITERKRTQQQLADRAEELARSNAELEQFAHIASHDLQEPLRMVSSYCQLLKSRYHATLDDKANDFIDFAVGGAKRMQTLINDLLAFSRVGTAKTDFVATDCNALMGPVLANLELAIREHNVEIVCGKLPTVMADETQIAQLFQNLIGNAIKFGREDNPRVEIGAQKRKHDWLFSVQDNGIGIDPNFSERIFVIFQRLHTRSEYPGTGIGLAICKKIVERHNGKIWVKSKLSKGATFFFTLPRNREVGVRVIRETEVDTIEATEPVPIMNFGSERDAEENAGTSGRR
jgi:PAS domain S-box-containing protein